MKDHFHHESQWMRVSIGMEKEDQCCNWKQRTNVDQFSLRWRRRRRFLLFEKMKSVGEKTAPMFFLANCSKILFISLLLSEIRAQGEVRQRWLCQTNPHRCGNVFVHFNSFSNKNDFSSRAEMKFLFKLNPNEKRRKFIDQIWSLDNFINCSVFIVRREKWRFFEWRKTLEEQRIDLSKSQKKFCRCENGWRSTLHRFNATLKSAHCLWIDWKKSLRNKRFSSQYKLNKIWSVNKNRSEFQIKSQNDFELKEDENSLLSKWFAVGHEIVKDLHFVVKVVQQKEKLFE